MYFSKSAGGGGITRLGADGRLLFSHVGLRATPSKLSFSSNATDTFVQSAARLRNNCHRFVHKNTLSRSCCCCALFFEEAQASKNSGIFLSRIRVISQVLG